ncbi:5924_t:CDS:1, partial [Entrophospora sp. SA101]
LPPITTSANQPQQPNRGGPLLIVQQQSIQPAATTAITSATTTMQGLSSQTICQPSSQSSLQHSSRQTSPNINVNNNNNSQISSRHLSSIPPLQSHQQLLSNSLQPNVSSLEQRSQKPSVLLQPLPSIINTTTSNTNNT